MTARPIGYYVHHHGAGHRARAEAIAAKLEWPVVLIGTGIGASGIDLPDDRPASGRFDGRDEAIGRPAALHYAPLDHAGVRTRVARIAAWIADQQPVLMVVDVSVEVAMLTRLASVPTICLRLNGERNDGPHLEAFRSAAAILAPFHEVLDTPATPPWVRDKTRYFPGITAAPAAETAVDNRVLAVFGRGGAPGDGERLAAAARACPEWDWRVIGPASFPANIPSNLEFAGWVEAPECEIARAAVVVGGAGDGLVCAVMAADRPFVCVPEERPFAEQWATADGLHAMGAAIVLPDWPHGEHWPALLGRALALSSQVRRGLHDANGAQKAAAWLTTLALGATICREHAA
ncbi:MAG: glycosyltransferase [Novosphingobium sp.]|uniref:glycosyltransferase n=1 Tax=Novosphingobium sp. TaxID=1874826 RepID=UPI0012C8B6EE|nr:glycosyltransferase [Novosphingobium sp.]MPS68180.1 glycosyltransferase [Novosphingobium sp.]